MPTPIEILLDPISITVIVMYAALIAWELSFPAKQLPQVKAWRFRGMAAFLCYFYLSSYLPLLWDHYLIEFQLLDMTSLGTIGGAIVGLFVIELGIYIWHFSMHKSNFLWRVFHQMHHSAERLDTFGAFWFSPMDMIGFTFLGSICLGLLVGITPQAATVVLLITTFLAIFQHANVKTPRWIGYLVQRPEAHSYHHARGIHAGNYTDISVFDIFFGTFYNPKEFATETGFYDGASSRIWEMVTFRDVTQSAEQQSSLQQYAKRESKNAASTPYVEDGDGMDSQIPPLFEREVPENFVGSASEKN